MEGTHFELKPKKVPKIKIKKNYLNCIFLAIQFFRRYFTKIVEQIVRDDAERVSTLRYMLGCDNNRLFVFITALMF